MASRVAIGGKRNGPGIACHRQAWRRAGALVLSAVGIVVWLLAAPAAYSAQPSVGEVLRKVGYVYSHLRNYHIVAIRRDVYLRPRSGSSQKSVITLDAAGGGRVRLALRDEGLNILIVSNGKTTWHYAAGKKEYTEREAARLFASPGAPENVASRNDLLDQIQYRLVNRFVRLWQFADHARLKDVKEIKFQGAEARCYHVVFRSPRLTDQLWIDQSSFLVLREKSTQAIASPETRLMMDDDVRIREFGTNATHAPGFFNFTPPPGARRVATLNLPGISEGIVGASAGDFTLKDVQGRKISLSDFKGRTVLLTFWATWCPGCKKELPEIQKLYAQHKGGRNLVILAVDDENKATIRNYMRERHYTFTALVDHKRTLFKEFAVRFIPTVIIINRKGTIAQEIVGWDGPQKLLEALKHIAS